MEEGETRELLLLLLLLLLLMLLLLELLAGGGGKENKMAASSPVIGRRCHLSRCNGSALSANSSARFTCSKQWCIIPNSFRFN